MAVHFFLNFYNYGKLATEAISVGVGAIGRVRASGQMEVASEIHDQETQQSVYKKLITKTTIIAGSSLYVIGKTFEILAIPGGALFSWVARNIFGALSVFTMGRAAQEAYLCAQFRREIHQKLKPQSTTETLEEKAARYRKAFLYLREQIDVPETFKTLIEDRINTRSKEQMTPLDPREIQRIKDIMVRKELNIKFNWGSRRMGIETTHDIFKAAETLIELLQANSSDVDKKEAIAEAEKLISKVQRGNTKKIALHTVVMLAALVAFVAFLAGTLTTFGIVSYAISGISALLFLVAESYIVVYDKTNERYKKSLEKLVWEERWNAAHKINRDF